MFANVAGLRTDRRWGTLSGLLSSSCQSQSHVAAGVTVVTGNLLSWMLLDATSSASASSYSYSSSTTMIRSV